MKTQIKATTQVTSKSPQMSIQTNLQRHSSNTRVKKNIFNVSNSQYQQNKLSLPVSLQTTQKTINHNSQPQMRKYAQTIKRKASIRPSLGHNLEQVSISIPRNTIQPFKIPKIKLLKSLRKKAKYGALRLINRFGFNIHYIYRWDSNSWKSKTLSPNTFRWHAWAYQSSRPRSPNFQIKFDADLRRGKIDARNYSLKRYQSSGKPHPSAKKYQFTKVAGRRLDLLPSDKVKDQKWKKVTVDKKDYKTKQIKGQAFIKGKYDPHVVDPNDVEQGQIANCYLMAAMASIARANPDAIKRLIRPKGKGIYDITIYVNSNANDKPGEGERTPIVITVDDTFPTSSVGKEVFAQRGDVNADGKPELWVMLIEKAYATHKGSYNSTAWGNPGEAMATLTGNRSNTYYTDKYKDKEIAKIINNSLSKNLPITASTPAMSETLKEQAKEINSNIGEKHAYSVKKVNLNSLTISLQNPWGSDYDVNNLAITEFRRFYNKFQIGR